MPNELEAQAVGLTEEPSIKASVSQEASFEVYLSFKEIHQSGEQWEGAKRILAVSKYWLGCSTKTVATESTAIGSTLLSPAA